MFYYVQNKHDLFKYYPLSDTFTLNLGRLTLTIDVNFF